VSSRGNGYIGLAPCVTVSALNWTYRTLPVFGASPRPTSVGYCSIESLSQRIFFFS